MFPYQPQFLSPCRAHSTKSGERPSQPHTRPFSPPTTFLLHFRHLHSSLHLSLYSRRICNREQGRHHAREEAKVASCVCSCPVKATAKKLAGDGPSPPPLHFVPCCSSSSLHRAVRRECRGSFRDTSSARNRRVDARKEELRRPV